MITEIKIGGVVDLIMESGDYSKEAAFIMAAILDEKDETGSANENKSLYIHHGIFEKCFYETKSYKDAACIIEKSVRYNWCRNKDEWLKWFNGGSGYQLTLDSTEIQFKNALKARLQEMKESIELIELKNSVLVFWEMHLPWCEHDYTPFKFS